MLVACWSLVDGLKFSMLPDRGSAGFKMWWGLFFMMPSARFFEQTAGQTLILPAGTFHYVCERNATFEPLPPPSPRLDPPPPPPLLLSFLSLSLLLLLPPPPTPILSLLLLSLPLLSRLPSPPLSYNTLPSLLTPPTHP